MPQLIQFAGGRSIVFELRRKSVTVGRSTKAGLRIRDRAASRFHFRIERTDAGYKIADLDSQNGTFVNGVQVREERPLRVGDRIDVGMTTFFFGKVVKPAGAEGAPSGGGDRYKTQRFLRPVDRSRKKVEVRKLLKEREQLLQIQRINRDLNSEMELAPLLNGIMDAVLELTGAERGFLILSEEGQPGDERAGPGGQGGEADPLAFAVARNLKKEEVESPEFQISRSIAREVLAQGRAVLTQNAEDDERFREIASVKDQKLRSILCLPLRLRGETLGVIYIDNPYQKGIFTEDDLEAMKGFADQAAVAIQNARLFEAAVRDGCTGLFGHAYFEKRLSEGLKAEPSSASVAILDLDRFKAVNDLYGHEAGNRILAETAALVREAASEREGAVEARFGGDEFEVFLPGAGRDEALAFAEALRRCVEETPFCVEASTLHLTISAGVASYPSDATDGDALLRRADEALYRAKRLGRNRTEACSRGNRRALGGITGRPEIDRLAFSRDGLMMMGCIARLLEADLSFEGMVDVLLRSALEGLDAGTASLSLRREGAGGRFHRRRAGGGVEEGLPPGAPAEAVERLEEKGGAGRVRLPRHLLGCVLAGRRDEPLGVLVLGRPPDRPFIEEDAELLSLFASKAGRPLENALQFRKAQEELLRASRALQDGVGRMQEAFSYGGIVGASAGMREVFGILEKIRDTELPVLILGESGTGKELAARAIHFRSPRRDKVFLSENCAAIPDALLESELFGHRRGAFTGADRDRKGLFEMAEGGTLFLDEVGDMSLPMQARLLRVLEAGEVRPVGADGTHRVDVRILAATNQDLEKGVEGGTFRRDLYHRLNVVSLKLPPLRDRAEDVRLLAEYFLARTAEEGEARKTFSPEALERLAGYAWPGNVRELMNEVSRASVLCPHAVIDEAWLSPAVRGEGEPGAGDKDEIPPLKPAVEEVEKTLIRRALAATDGNKTHAARMLKLSWLGLQKKMERYGLK